MSFFIAPHHVDSLGFGVSIVNEVWRSEDDGNLCAQQGQSQMGSLK
jgi:hypothetical protein